ncbi:MAG: CynX/NimT family MFS transporter [Ardenticatenaceae bacterium]
MKKWWILALAAFTSMLVYAMPLLSLPVLFTEIAADLDMTILQIGVVWGAASFAGFLVSIPMGILGDRFGPRLTIGVACLLVGVFGALRAFSFNYISFMITVLLHGLVMPAIPPNLHKAAGAWFTERRGLATGVVSAGFAIGLTLGSSLSASVLSPLLGGWGAVLILYGAAGIIFGVLWLLFYPAAEAQPRSASKKPVYIDALRHIVQSRELWLIGLGTGSFWACYRGFSGYLPLYLKEIGWSPLLADQTLATFFFVSLIGVMPLSLLSDRLRSRRIFMVVSLAVMSIGVLSFSIIDGILIWIALIVAGFFFDAYMSIHQAAAQEVDGIDYKYVGTALGFIATLREAGGFMSPPIGNALAEYGLSTPFIFWGIMGVIGAAILWQLPRRAALE